MSEPRNVFAEMQAIVTGVLGVLAGADPANPPPPTTVAIGGDDPVSGYIKSITLDEIIVAGGKAEKGGFVIVVSIYDCPDDIEPAKFTVIELSDGRTAQVLRVLNDGGLLTIYCGSPLASDRRSSLMG